MGNMRSYMDKQNDVEDEKKSPLLRFNRSEKSTRKKDDEEFFKTRKKDSEVETNRLKSFKEGYLGKHPNRTLLEIDEKFYSRDIEIDLKIHNKIKEAVPGSVISCEANISSPYGAPEFFQYEWYCIYDTTHMTEKDKQEIGHHDGGENIYHVYGGKKYNCKLPSWTGRHRIICAIKVSGVPYRYIEFYQDTIPHKKKTEGFFDKYGSKMEPETFLALLNLQRKSLSMSSDEDDREKLEKLDDILETLDKEHFEISSGKRSTEQYKSLAIKALLVPTSHPEPVPLLVFLNPMKDGSWKIIDATDPANTRSYEGKPPEGNMSAEEKMRHAIKAAWKAFMGSNTRPEGYIMAEAPAGFGFKEGEKWQGHSDGIGKWDEIAHWLSRVSMGLAIVGIGMMLIPIPGFRVAGSGMPGISGATEATGSGFRIYDRYTHGNLKANKETFLDLTVIAASLAASTGSFISMGSKAARMGKLPEAFIYSEAIEAGIDGSSALVMTGIHVKRIMEIQKQIESGELSYESGKELIKTELQEAGQDTGFFLFGIKQAKSVVRDIKKGKNIRSIKSVELPLVSGKENIMDGYQLRDSMNTRTRLNELDNSYDAHRTIKNRLNGIVDNRKSFVLQDRDILAARKKIDDLNISDRAVVNEILSNGNLVNKIKSIDRSKLDDFIKYVRAQAPARNGDWATVAEIYHGKRPPGELSPTGKWHGHHIVHKGANPATNPEAYHWSEKSKAILDKYDLDWFSGKENIVWAPHDWPGLHTATQQKKVYEALKKASLFGKEAIKEKLKDISSSYLKGERL